MTQRGVNVEQWRPLVAKHFPAKEVNNALRIIQCESGGNPDAIGDGHLTFKQAGVEYGKSYGLFQYRHLPGRIKALDPETNIKVAAALFKARGWSPWTCKKVLS